MVQILFKKNNLKTFIHRMKFYLTILLSLLCCATKAQVDFNHYTISTLTPEDGLSQGSNHFRFEDSRGFMWIAANDAVNRYDGSKVKVFNLNKYFSNCPVMQKAYGFAEDDAANVYVGSEIGLYKYNRTKDKFTLLTIFKDGKEAMPFAYKDGKIWCFNKQYKIASYNVKTTEIIYYNNAIVEPIKALHIYAVWENMFYYRFPFFDKSNNIWIVSTNEISSYNIVSNTFSVVEKNYFNNNGLKIRSSTYNPDDNSIALTTINTIEKYDINTHKIKSVKEYKFGNDEKGFGDIFYFDAHYYFLAGGKVRVANNSLDSFVVLNNTALNNKALYRFGVDKNNRLWFCNDAYGQIILNFNSKLLNKLPKDEDDKVLKAGVSTFAEFENKDILVQSYAVKRGESLVYKPYVNRNDLEFNFITSTDINRKGIWYQTNDKDGNIFTYFINNANGKQLKNKIEASKKYGVVQNILVLDNGNLLCSFSNALINYNPNTNEIIEYKQPYNNSFVSSKIGKNKLAISYIGNDMWIAGIDGNELKFEQKILPSVQSFYAQYDSVQQQYWIATNKGIFILDKNFTTIKAIDANNGLAGTYIYGLLQDDIGNMWCSHQHGLSSINKKTLDVINYTKEDGIQSYDYNNRAFYKATDGTLYFGGSNGFNYFKPPLLKKSSYKSQIYVDDILVNNIAYLVDTSADLITKLDLKYTQKSISFNVEIKNLGNAKDQQIWYRLNDSVWNKMANSGVINFNNLAPNTYKLEIAVFDKFAQKIEVQKQIFITIERPFYLAIWFWVLTSIFFTSLILWLLNKNKIKVQDRKFKEQLALTNQRLKLTADLHDDIGASLSSLQVNSVVANLLINTKPLEAKEILNKIEDQSKRISEKIGDIIWSMKPGSDEFMTMSSRIKTFVSDILGATNINYSINIDNQIDDLITDITTRKNIVLIIKEAVNNAVKYSQATEVNINAALQNNMVIINVKDNGVGMQLNAKLGNGMSNMQKRVTELNGKFEIVSEPNKGVSLTAIIPILP